MIRVLFVYRYCTRGGVETGLRFRLATLPAEGVEGHALFLEDYGGRAAFADLDGRVFVEAGEDAFARRLASERFDVVSIIDTYEVLDWLARARFAGGVLLELRSTYEHTLVNLRALGGKRVHGVLTPSRYQAEAVQRYLPRTWRGQIPTHVAPNFIDLERFARAAADAPAAPQPVLCWVGRLDALKNWEDFLAIGQAVARTRPVEWWMIGGAGAESDELLRFRTQLGRLPAAAGELPPAARLRWWPAVAGADMPRVYGCVRASGGVVLVTSRNESFGFVALEALAAGCPVVAARVGGIPEVISNGAGGLLYTSGDVEAAAGLVGRLLDDPAERAALVARGADDVAARFSPAACARQFAAALRAALDAARGMRTA